MSRSKRIVGVTFLVGATVLLAAATAHVVRKKHQQAEAAVQSIEDELDALDPATRAAVVARLGSDEARRIHSH